MESCKQPDSDNTSHVENTRGQFNSDFRGSESELIPGLPHDIGILCLARVPRRDHQRLKCVSKKWRDFLSSEVYFYRQRLGIADSWIYALCRDSSECVHCYVLDPARRKWKKLPALPYPCSKRYGMTCEVLGRKLYLLGGCGWTEDATNEVNCYDPLLNQWEKVANMETARCHFVSGSVDGRLYAIGGIGSNSGALTSWETYDSEANEWTSHEDLNILPDLGEALAFDGRIYIRHISTNVFPAIYAAIYDTSNDVWSAVDNEMTMNWYGPAIVVGHDVYMLDQTAGIKLMMLDKENQSWVSVGRISTYLIKTPCRITAIGTMLFVIGRGLQTLMLDLEKVGRVRGTLTTTSIPGLGSVDDIIISCKTIAI